MLLAHFGFDLHVTFVLHSRQCLYTYTSPNPVRLPTSPPALCSQVDLTLMVKAYFVHFASSSHTSKSAPLCELNNTSKENNKKHDIPGLAGFNSIFLDPGI